jgi:hypothetical protein
VICRRNSNPFSLPHFFISARGQFRRRFIMSFPIYASQWLRFSLICGVLGVGGCSAARPPEAAVGQAELAVRQAAESKAPAYAPSEFRIAQEKSLGAQRAMLEEEYEHARRLAEQAVTDAQLAQARAGAAEAQKNVEEVRRTMNALQSEASRPMTP